MVTPTLSMTEEGSSWLKWEYEGLVYRVQWNREPDIGRKIVEIGLLEVSTQKDKGR